MDTITKMPLQTRQETINVPAIPTVVGTRESAKTTKYVSQRGGRAESVQFRQASGGFNLSHNRRNDAVRKAL